MYRLYVNHKTCLFFVSNMYIHCMMYMYYKCTGNVYTSSLSLEMVYTCIFSLCTCTDSVHTCICFPYLLFTCFNMSIPCIYRSKDIHTWYIQVQTCIYSFLTKSKRSIIAGLEPMTSCIPASCLDRCATSVLVIGQRFVV